MNTEYEATLDRLLDALDASTEVRELARGFAHRAFAAELHEHRSIESVVGSAVYAAFRRAGNAHSLEEIAGVVEESHTALSRAYKHLSRELDIDLEPPDPHEFVERFAAPLAIGDRTEAAAHEIIDATIEAGLHTGVSPDGVAAGALYLADCEHHDRLNQQEIADVTEVSTITIRHRYNEQAKLVDVSDDGTIPAGRGRFFDTK